MRVLFAEMGHHGGSVNRLLLLLRAIDRSRVEPALLSFYADSTAGELLDPALDFPKENLLVVGDPAPESLALIRGLPVPTAFGFRYFRRAARALVRHRPDLVYLNNTPFSHLPLVLASRRRRVPYLVHMRDSIQLTRSERWAVAGAARTIVLSEASKDFYARQGVPKDRMEVIYDGIDLGTFDSAPKEAPLPEGRLVLALAGTLVARKRAGLAIDATARLARDFPELILLILGDGPDRAALEGRVRAAGAEKHVRILGWTKNVAGHLRNAHVGLMVSEREGMPNVVLEYMAAGLPVVATDLPGIREMVGDSETGFVVSRDDPGEIEAALRRLLEDPARRRGMGLAGRSVLASGRFSVRDEHGAVLRILEGVAT